MERSSVLQVTMLESMEQPDHVVCLCNTHLYFHPTACNIRLILAAAALRHIQAICDAYTQEGKTTGMVFCGDFNSAPHLGVYQLMTFQMVPSDHADWSSDGKEQLLSTLELHQPMNIISACGTPAYTNYTSGFQATLDYIFIDDDRLEVTKIVPLPSDEEVKANIAIPSQVFPSDHLALVCDLKFS
ncbi:2',5'-phosphodiesterase 12 [Elysia marginata]|uniref:2',5'-phosphodiesterase 12 n=1 Tax=Elysia marginata TaxID=1093978 RepID=A0AAV4GHU7_9GAST|nr:2',5'-phosphodiesterase 12 [Elysia marginata]